MYPESLLKYIPPNFDLSKYDKAANMELINWIENLAMRLLGFAASKNKLALLDAKQKALIEGLTQQIINQGVVLGSQYSAMLDEMLKKDDAEYTSIVRDITYYELFSLSDILKTTDMDKLYSEVKSIFLHPLNQQELGKLNDPLPTYRENDEARLSLLEVDMNCSDSEITAAFSEWLKHTRAKELSETSMLKRREHKLNKFNPVAFRKWHDAQVLAYLDLITWNNLKGNKTTSKIIGDILFPDPKSLRDSTAMINDTVKPLANKLTSLTTTRRMLKVVADKSRKKTA